MLLLVKKKNSPLIVHCTVHTIIDINEIISRSCFFVKKNNGYEVKNRGEHCVWLQLG